MAARYTILLVLLGCHGAELAETPAVPVPSASASPPQGSATSPPQPPSPSESPHGRVSIGKLFENPPTWDVRGMFEQNETKFEDCWAPVLKTQPNERGKLSVRFIVSPEGKVTKTEEVSSTFRDANLSSCVQNVIANLPWPSPGGTATVILPLVFRP